MGAPGSDPSHLPNLGGARAIEGPPPRLPTQRRGIAPQMRGRYPDYDVLAEAGHWDALTRGVVLGRVANVPPIRFFDEREERVLRAFCDVVIAQDRDPRIPVLEMVDAKLYGDELDGYRYEDLPSDPQTWRLVAAHLDATARERGAAGFPEASGDEQHEIVRAFAEGQLRWEGIPVARAWGVVMRGVLSAFYSHPWAWNEIGFGGPAYPRGFARLDAGERESWERPPSFDVDPVRDVPARRVEGR